jgi:1,4-alpha-glucan branching enzyme
MESLSSNANYLDLPLVTEDDWLLPHSKQLSDRMLYFLNMVRKLELRFDDLGEFSALHHFLGFTYDEEDMGWWYREWAPNAYMLWLTGDFNRWNKKSHPLTKAESGVWEIFLPDQEYKGFLKHGSLLKVIVSGENGVHERIPSFIKRAVQDDHTKIFSGQFWNPKHEFDWGGDNFDPRSLKELYVYEAHPGIATEEERVGTWKEFEDHVLPRIEKLGYNVIQLMAVQEHPYYGSFGYHVSNFFAPSSRFGTPEDLKSLVKAAHQKGIAVVMDLVHSHAVKNYAEGLNQFDGQEGQYFHEGERGNHPDWDSKLFDYGKTEVLQFLTSNIRYWLEEFRFDGFRFDGVTSMLYHHHGSTSFDRREAYFDGVDTDAIAYLQLANTIAHSVRPGCITIAEDVSGMPGLCRRILDGGIGFDYRLAMGVPDFWIRYLKHVQDEHWNVDEIWYELNNIRHSEKHIGYAESHDQAFVGDKTIAFWLMDKEMYTHMNKGNESLVIDRGMALHKMIRMITASLSGNGYLNFEGNEFGHPEWIDLPREGNNWGYKYARRQWSLADSPFLRYQHLLAFDRAMIVLLKSNRALSSRSNRLHSHVANQTLAFERSGLVFVFNFNGNRAFTDYPIHAPGHGKYQIVLDSDEEDFDGQGRLDHETEFFTDENKCLQLYLPPRVCVVLKKVD